MYKERSFHKTIAQTGYGLC